MSEDPKVTSALIDAQAEPAEAEDRLKDSIVKGKPMRRTWTPNSDPFLHIPRKKNLHYCIVREMPASAGIRIKQKYLDQGYTIEAEIEGSEIYLMAIPHQDYVERRAYFDDLAKQQRTGGADFSEGLDPGDRRTYSKTSRGLSAEEMQAALTAMNA